MVGPDSRRKRHLVAQRNVFFNAETGNAFTTVFAGLALTITTFPNTSLLPAFVAGFRRVLIIHKPGSTNLPALFTCCVAISAKLFTTLVHSDFLISVAAESASASAPLDMGFTPAFIAFMGAMVQLEVGDLIWHAKCGSEAWA